MGWNAMEEMADMGMSHRVDTEREGRLQLGYYIQQCADWQRTAGVMGHEEEEEEEPFQTLAPPPPPRFPSFIAPGAGGSTAVVGMRAGAATVVRVPVERPAQVVWFPAPHPHIGQCRERRADVWRHASWRSWEGDGGGGGGEEKGGSPAARSSVFWEDAPSWSGEKWKREEGSGWLLAIGPTVYLAERREGETPPIRPARRGNQKEEEDEKVRWENGEAKRRSSPPPFFASSSSRVASMPLHGGASLDTKDDEEETQRSGDVAVWFAYVEALESAGDISPTSDVPSVWAFLSSPTTPKEGKATEEEEKTEANRRRRLVLSLLGWGPPPPHFPMSVEKDRIQAEKSAEGGHCTEKGQPHPSSHLPSPPPPQRSPLALQSSVPWREKEVMRAALYGDFPRVLHYLSSSNPTPLADPSLDSFSFSTDASLLSMAVYYIHHRTQWARLIVDSDPPILQSFLSQFPLWLVVCLLACCTAPPPPPLRSSSSSRMGTTPNEAEEEEAEEKDEEDEAARQAALFSSAAAKTWTYRWEMVYHHPHLSCWDRFALALLLEWGAPFSSSSSSATTEEEGKAHSSPPPPTPLYTPPPKDAPSPLHTDPSSSLSAAPPRARDRLWCVLRALYQDGSVLQAVLFCHGIGVASLPWMQMVVDETGDYLLGACLWARVGVRTAMDDDDDEEKEEKAPHTTPLPRSLLSPSSSYSSCFLPSGACERSTRTSPADHWGNAEEAAAAARARRFARWRARVCDERWMEVDETSSSSSSSSLVPTPSTSSPRASASPPHVDGPPPTRPPTTMQPIKTTKTPYDHHHPRPSSSSPPRPLSPGMEERWRWWADAHEARLRSTQSFMEWTEFRIACRQLRAASRHFSSSSTFSSSSCGLSPLSRDRVQKAAKKHRRMVGRGPCGGASPRCRWCDVCGEKVEEVGFDGRKTMTPEEEEDLQRTTRRCHSNEGKEKNNPKEEEEDRFPMASGDALSPFSPLFSSTCVRASPLEWPSAYVQCAMCGHGGHLHHISGWFDTHRVCPAENCTCCCNEG